MSKTSNLDILRNCGTLVEELKKNPLTKKQWVAIDKKMQKLHKRQDAERELIRMTPEKYHQRFTI
jgi:hypothetical protein